MGGTFYNPDFNRMEFQTVRSEPERRVMTPIQWIEKMNAIGIVTEAGRCGGTYAHFDIAFEFASWVSLEFKQYLIKDYQWLKKDEAQCLSVGWDAKRELAKEKSSLCENIRGMKWPHGVVILWSVHTGKCSTCVQLKK